MRTVEWRNHRLFGQAELRNHEHGAFVSSRRDRGPGARADRALVLRFIIHFGNPMKHDEILEKYVM